MYSMYHMCDMYYLYYMYNLYIYIYTHICICMCIFISAAEVPKVDKDHKGHHRFVASPTYRLQAREKGRSKRTQPDTERFLLNRI